MLWVAIDWGSSHFRAYLMSGHQLQDVKQSSQGVFNFSDNDYQTYLAEVLSQWQLPANSLVLMAGMIGSKQGWLNCDYVPCPVTANDLSQRLNPVANDLNLDIFIVSGVNYQTNQYFDVMRGEEVQVIGAGVSDGWLCLPGTHSKWVKIENGVICQFKTFMTGELYQLLSTQSSLSGCLVQNAELDEDEFIAGCERGMQGNGLTHELFAIRANNVCGADVTFANSYLSGLLIAQEFSAINDMSIAQFFLLASDNLVANYQLAAKHLGLDCRVLDCQQATIDGLCLLADKLTSKG